MSNNPDIAARLVLERTYWVVLVGFTCVVAAFTRDRACFDHLNLLPAAARQPVVAWLIAGVYVSGHCWIAGAYALTVRHTGRLLPDPRQVRTLWGDGRRHVLLLLVLGVEYTPASLLSAAATLMRLCGE